MQQEINMLRNINKNNSNEDIEALQKKIEQQRGGVVESKRRIWEEDSHSRESFECKDKSVPREEIVDRLKLLSCIELEIELFCKVKQV